MYVQVLSLDDLWTLSEKILGTPREGNVEREETMRDSRLTELEESVSRVPQVTRGGPKGDVHVFGLSREFRYSTPLETRVEKTKEREVLVTGNDGLHVTERSATK